MTKTVMIKVAQSTLLIASIAFCTPDVTAESPTAVSDSELSAWVRQKVQERQPSAADKHFDEIGWARDIRHATQLAREHNRPVFLFTHDGRMNLGRC